MNLSWDRLRVLDAVARTGSVTHAANLLHMTGPAVSQQLRRMEAEVRAKVVEPCGRGVRLTSAGELLAMRARQVANIMQEAENDLTEDRAPVTVLRIGAPASVIRGHLASIIASMKQQWPECVFHLEDGETVNHLDQLSRGRLDLVLAESWEALPVEISARVTAEQLCRQPLSLALWEGHPLADRKSLDFRELASEAWATCGQSSGAHIGLVPAARRQGVELDVRYFLADHVTQCEVIRQKLAVGCVPEVENREGLALVPMKEALSREILILTEAKVPSTPLARLLSQLRGERRVSGSD